MHKSKVVKLIILFFMVSRGNRAKKKKDTVNSQTRKESKDPKGDEAMDGTVRLTSFARKDLKSRLLGLHFSPTLSPNVSHKHTYHQLRPNLHADDDEAQWFEGRTSQNFDD